MARGWKANNISPMLAVADMDVSVAFYREVLGFEAYMESPKYSIMERDGRLIHLKLAWAPAETMKTVSLHTEFYMEVAGIRPLWEHVKTFKDRYKMRELFETDYGMTEFHIRDANNCLIFVGEATSRAGG